MWKIVYFISTTQANDVVFWGWKTMKRQPWKSIDQQYLLYFMIETTRLSCVDGLCGVRGTSTPFSCVRSASVAWVRCLLLGKGVYGTLSIRKRYCTEAAFCKVLRDPFHWVLRLWCLPWGSQEHRSDAMVFCDHFPVVTLRWRGHVHTRSRLFAFVRDLDQ